MSRELEKLIAAMGPEELLVLEQVALGIVKGRRVYGEMKIASDKRDFAKETLEEVRDALVYVGAQLIRLEMK